ncbi:MAG: hypothetical protein KA354_08965 [Phycisphaerae bacterium]|nr:hypothetical protein [Phycisphaerae bacterium]
MITRYTRQHRVLASRRSASLRTACLWLWALGGLAMTGCHSAGTAPTIEPDQQSQADRQRQLFGEFDIPRKIGTVENVGLQIPVVSPDGRQMLYLRTDCESLSPMTLLGSTDPQDTPPGRTLSIWIRPVEGSGVGQQLSKCSWAHSPTWSRSGAAVACAAGNPPHCDIVHIDMASGKATILGLPGTVNCLPRFDVDDRTLLFCSGERAKGPFRVYRQTLDAAPVALSPPGSDCLFPVTSEKTGRVLCARANTKYLHWATCDTDGITDLIPKCGLSGRPLLLQTWAGIASPLSPDRGAVLFFDTGQNRIAVLHAAQRLVRRHRSGSIAACWIDEQTIALATPEAVFVVNTTTGVSTSLFSGSWIPSRYVPSSRRLLLLGQERAGRFSIWEVVFKGGPADTT